MWENTVTVAINPEFSKRLIKVVKEQVIPGLTTEEKQQLAKAMKILEGVLYKPLWDMNTKELGLTPLKEKDDKGNN